MLSVSKRTSRRRVGFTTIISSLFLIATLVWGTATLIMIQMGEGRIQTPHQPYSEIEDWAYNIDWAGGRSTWFDNINYTDLPLDQPLPDDLMDQLENVIFIAEPASPAQLWRSSSYDSYDGSSWGKSRSDEYSVATISSAQAEAQGNEIYTVYLNLTAGSSVGEVQLPVLFPEQQIITDSFTTYPSGRLLSYTLATDDYGTVLLGPTVQGDAGENVLFSYQVTYMTQDLASIEADAIEGPNAGVNAPPTIRNLYSDLDVSLTQRVQDNISQFDWLNSLDNSSTFDVAMYVDQYFKNTFELMMDENEYMERPPDGQEVTDWFLERGGGLPMDFATAYTVYMRGLDIPARVAMGYAVGDQDGNQRVVRVRHMMFWVEVYIPTTSGGEWVQVLPFSLTPDMGGGQDPANVDESSIEIYIFPSNSSQPYAIIGEEFNMSSVMLVEGFPVSQPEVIEFYDHTDDVAMGSATIEQGTLLPLANLSYTFPQGSSPGYHNISATWNGPDFSIANWTEFYVVGTASPISPPSVGIADGSLGYHLPVVEPETIDLSIKNGLDNYTVYWNDTIHVHGVLTVSGEPVDGTTLDNDQVQILWDGGFYANATVGADGSYSIDIFADPSDLIRMTVGGHEVQAYYAGEYTSEGFPEILPGSSPISELTLKGLVNFTLTVTPTSTVRGDTIMYEGIAQLRNGTVLNGITIGVLLDGVVVNTTTTNSSGGFVGYYTIPGSYPSGVFPATVNWTSPNTGIFANISGDTSYDIPVAVQTGSTDLSIQSDPPAPGPIHIYETITISGYLTENETGSGIVGRDVTIFWDNGSAYTMGTNTTVTDGYYELTFQVSDGYLGDVIVWAEFDGTSDPSYLSSQSSNLTMTVVQWVTEVQLSASPNPVHLQEDLLIFVRVYLPEIPGYLTQAPVTIWWKNSTHTHNLTIEVTNSSGWIEYAYRIPIDHSFEIVNITAEFVSPSLAFADDVSDSEFIQVTNYLTTLTINSNSTIYHLNETVYIWGHLEHENGTPLAGQTIDIDWDWNNGTLHQFSLTTNDTGDYEYFFSFSLSDGQGTIDVTANYTSPTILYNGSIAYLSPSIIHQLYQLNLTGSFDRSPAEYHLDESFIFSGQLTFVENGNPIAGATITVSYLNSSGVFNYNKITNSTGGFLFQYNCSLNDALGAIYVWASYLSTDPLWDDAQSANRTADLILYQMTLTVSTDSSSYFLDQVVNVTGRLTFQDNGSALANEAIRIWWNNGSAYAFEWYYTDSNGYYTFLYNLSLSDDTGTVDVWAEFENAVALWDNATSSTVQISLNLYSFDLTITTDSASYFLDEIVHVSGQLTFSHNSTPVNNGAIRILWNNGSVYTFQWYYTDASGNFDFYYNLSTSDANVTVFIQAEFENINPLWNNASSNIVSISLNYYSFDLGASTDSGFYFLDEVVHVYGQLTFSHNGTELAGQPIGIEWNNGSAWIFQWYYTNSTGYYNFYYNLSTSDSAGAIDIRSHFVNSNPLWNNATSLVHSISVGRYSTSLTVTVSPSPVYLNETITIYVLLEFTHNSTGISGQSVSLYWNNGTEYLITTVITDANGEYWYIYSSMDQDSIWTGITVHGEYIGTSLIDGDNSTNQSLTLQQWPTIITGLDTGGITIFHLTETIVITGSLYYDTNPDVAFGGETLDILLDGWLANQTITLSDGSFTAYWYINSSTSYDTYTLTVRYQSGVNWIADTSDSLLITISENSLTWTFVLNPSYPTVIYLEETVDITGSLTLDNGTPYSGATVELWWRHGTGVATLIDTVITLGDGTFSYALFIDASTPTGISSIWANCTPIESYIAAGQSDTLLMDIQVITVVITCTTDTDWDYRGNSVTISGSLEFSNGSAMVGYDVGIFWAGSLITNETTDVSGEYSYTFTIAWTDSVGSVTYYAVFTSPSDAFSSAESSSSTFEVRDLIQLHLDSQAVTEILAGSDITVSGYVTNGNGRVQGVTIQIEFDSSPYSDSDSTDSNGVFSIVFTIPSSTSAGDHVLSVSVASSYYDIDGSADSWTITVKATSEVEIEFTEFADTMVGETIHFQFRVLKSSGESITTGSVVIELGSVILGSWSIADDIWTTGSYTLPSSWSGGSGLFTLHASYDGTTDIEGSEADSVESIHIFTTNIVFDTSQTLSVVIPGQALVIDCRLLDDSTNSLAIVDRAVRINLNGTSSITLTTDSDGRIRHTVYDSAPEGVFNYSITLLSPSEDIQSDTRTIQIGILPIPGLETTLIIMWIAIIGIEVVVAMIIFARYGEKLSRWTRRFRFRLWDGTKTNYYTRHGW
ncbi:MAG: hypothetical protein BAJATHORv1_20075 [Candidatus Thorarchaeota archaeon]|nr:MAG: hypothetical protein BAJATHORv1_20075 [Candidatus Thorarchaeota archaeon]